MAKSTYGKNILANVTSPSGDLNSEKISFFKFLITKFIRKQMT